MPDHKKPNLRISFINVTMKDINSLTDDLYESLVDEDYDTIKITIKKLNVILKDIQKLTKDGVQT